MNRIAIFFKLKEGKAQGYKKMHDEIWPQMTEILDIAGFRNYTIWRKDDMLFAYYEIKDEQRAEIILSESSVYARWRECMEEFVWKDPVTGQKEWRMENMFTHE